MRVLITGGPTHEYLDPVRCLTNPSTGRMGMALARAAAKRGHRTVLVTGPTIFPDPKGVRVVRVVSALDMDRAVRREFPICDVVIGSAAVSDYRPESAAASKIKKGPAMMTLRLLKNPDVLGGCGARKGKRLLVGFALETDCGLENAADKMRRKRLDLIVLNGPESFGANRIGPTLLTPDGKRRAFGAMTKDRLAAKIVVFVEGLRR
ncbi:MAG: phosphopantothenoylcysteine decarboxylase / phosphopantothenate--cysteine [Planctomycetota bacterium]|nr:MAG: phosphopantothenoylcysteine decarboxylase / phosphopantothenate--cysteine [Planctomycetota bacterium]